MIQRHNFSDACEALAPKYLRDFELAEYYRDKERTRSVKLIKQRLFDDIWRRMQRYGEKEPPFLNNQEFIHNGCRAHIKEVPGVKHAFMQVHASKFIVYVDKDLKDVHKRIYIAHELGHTFLYDLDKVPLQPYFERKRSSDLLERNVYSRDEGLVYEIGRFLLVPSNVLDDYVPCAASLAALIGACETFATTTDIMARRLLWDIYDWQSGTKYWEDALVLFYPISEAIANDRSSPPKGLGKVFRGKSFKNLQIEKAWHVLACLSDLALEKPGKVVPLRECEGFDWFKPIKFRSTTLRVEAEYIPKDYRVYILMAPELPIYP